MCLFFKCRNLEQDFIGVRNVRYNRKQETDESETILISETTCMHEWFQAQDGLVGVQVGVSDPKVMRCCTC
jgi:hypothetical protein